MSTNKLPQVINMQKLSETIEKDMSQLKSNYDNKVRAVKKKITQLSVKKDVVSQGIIRDIKRDMRVEKAEFDDEYDKKGKELHELYRLSERIVIPLNRITKENLMTIAYLKRVTMSDIVRELIDVYIKKHTKNMEQYT